MDRRDEEGEEVVLLQLPMILVEKDGRIVQANAQTERTHGYGRAELLQQDPPPYVPGMDIAGVISEIGEGVDHVAVREHDEVGDVRLGNRLRGTDLCHRSLSASVCSASTRAR